MIQQPDDYRAELHIVHIIKIMNQQYIYGVDFEQDQNIYYKLQWRVFTTKDRQRFHELKDFRSFWFKIARLDSLKLKSIADWF